MGRKKGRGLGHIRSIGLADARKLKNAFKHELAMGVNPQEKKCAEREEAARVEAIKAMTFARVVEEWYQQQAEAWSASHCTDVRHKLRAYILPRLGESPVREISTQAVLSLLQVIEQRTPESAYKSKLIVGQVLRFAIARGDAEIDVTVNLKGALKPRRVRYFGALTAPRDVADLMTRIESYSGSPVVRAALWFSLYMFQRPGEIRKAEWMEMDFDAALCKYFYRQQAFFKRPPRRGEGHRACHTSWGWGALSPPPSSSPPEGENPPCGPRALGAPSGAPGCG